MKVTLHYHNGNKEVLRGVTFIKRKSYNSIGKYVDKQKNTIGNYTYVINNEHDYLDILYDSGIKKVVELELLKHFKVEKEVLWK